MANVLKLTQEQKWAAEVAEEKKRDQQRKDKRALDDFYSSQTTVPVYHSEGELEKIYSKASEKEKRAIESFVIAQPLAKINGGDTLRFLASIIQDHDHLAEKLQSEPNRRLRRAKFDAIKPYLKFDAHAYSWYELPPNERGHLWIPHYA